jgi:hypothetical protein
MPVAWSAVAALIGGLAAILAVVVGMGLAVAGVAGVIVTFGSAAWLGSRPRIGSRLPVMWTFSAAFILLEWPVLALLALALLTRPSDWG